MSFILKKKKLFYSISLLLCLALQKLATQINDLLQSGRKVIIGEEKYPRDQLKQKHEITAVFLKLNCAS